MGQVGLKQAGVGRASLAAGLPAELPLPSPGRSKRRGPGQGRSQCKGPGGGDASHPLVSSKDRRPGCCWEMWGRAGGLETPHGGPNAGNRKGLDLIPGVTGSPRRS